MSNRKSNSQKRREWWLLCIRERPEGRDINRSHCMRRDETLNQLIKEGVVTLFRRTQSSGYALTRYSCVKMTDGSVNPPGHVVCPDCKRSGVRTNTIAHKINCCLTRNAWSPVAFGIKANRGPKQLSATHLD